jgi:apolipoprotein N-acyltransferase
MTMSTATHADTPKVRPLVRAATARRISIGAALGAVSAAMLILAFPPYNAWPLIFVAFVPMVLADNRVLPLRRAGLASAIGIGIWLLVYLTMIFGLSLDTWFMQAIAVLVSLLGYLSGRGLRVFHEQTRYRWFVLSGVVGIVGVEMIRSFIPIIATHAFVGHALHTQPWLIQPVSVFSIYGLDVLIMLVNSTLGLAALGSFDRKWHWDEVPALDGRMRRRWLAGTGILLAAWVGLSLSLLAGAPTDAPAIRVAGVQHGYVRPGHMDPDTQVARLEQLSIRTQEAAGQGARLVVWPELGLGFDPQAQHTEELRALAAETGAHILIGYGLVSEGEWRNEALMLTPEGEFLDVYGKNYPSGEPHIVSSGVYPVYDTHLGKLAPIICNDVNYTAAARIPAAKGAQLVMVPTRMFAGVFKELPVKSVFRAVENRVATVMVDGAFRITMVDPYGRILADQSLPEGGANTVIADVPLGSPNTFYTRLGDWMGWLSLGGFIALAVLQELTKRQRTEK